MNDPTLANGTIDRPARADDDARYQLLGELAGKALEAFRAGEELDIDALAAGHPELAGQVRELVGTVRALDRLSAPAGKPQSPEMPALSRLGDYRLLREVGRGGMGVVYEAEQISLRRRVALKVLPFASMLDPRQLQRFHNEAQAAACLVHPNIVPVYAVGEERGVHYYAMQFVEGQSLADLVERLRGDAGLRPRQPSTQPGADGVIRVRPSADTVRLALSTERSTRDREFFRTAAQLGIQAAEALEYAHQMGVVHRDVKPANLLVDGRGKLWVTDFGLAQFTPAADRPGDGRGGLTRTGDLVGTLRYMSPEQAAARRGLVDHRSDVYSLGVTLYELLTLEAAFPGEDRVELLRQITQEDPLPPRRLNRAVPPELETVVLKALAKNPDERYATAQELADDLRRFREDKPVRARRPGVIERLRKWSWRHRRAVATGAGVLACAVVALAVGAAMLWQEKQRAERAERRAREAVDVMFTQVAEKWLARQPALDDLQRDFLVKAAGFYEASARDGGQAPEQRLDAARAYRRVGEIRRRLGERDAAAEAFGKAVAILEPLGRQRPNEPAHRAELALCHNGLGNLQRSANRLEDALKAYQSAEALFTALAAEQPKVRAYRDGLAGTRNNEGVVYHALGRTAPAEAAYRAAVALLTDLAGEEPKAPGYRADLAGSKDNLADLLREDGRRAEAEGQYRAAVDLWDRLVREYPAEALYREGLASAVCGLGVLLDEQGRKDAESLLQRAIAVREDLVRAHPRVPAYRLELAAAQNALGRYWAGKGQPAAAETAHRRAAALARPLTADWPETRAELAGAQDGLAAALAAAGRKEPAAQAKQEALALWQKLVEEFPTVPRYQKERDRSRTQP